jgi:hypothetical protein
MEGLCPGKACLADLLASDLEQLARAEDPVAEGATPHVLAGPSNHAGSRPFPLQIDRFRRAGLPIRRLDYRGSRELFEDLPAFDAS